MGEARRGSAQPRRTGDTKPVRDDAHGRRPRKRSADKPVVLTDPKAIRALAHPARLAVIDALFAGDQLTATECAAIVGLSPSAMSYHLRALERAGIVERVPSRTDGRERPWRAKGTQLSVSTAGSRAVAAATSAVVSTIITQLRTDLETWIGRSDAEDPQWREASGLSNSRLWLTLEEAQELEASNREFVDRVRGRTAANHPDGARRMRLALLVFPMAQNSPEPAS